MRTEKDQVGKTRRRYGLRKETEPTGVRDWDATKKDNESLETTTWSTVENKIWRFEIPAEIWGKETKIRISGSSRTDWTLRKSKEASWRLENWTEIRWRLSFGLRRENWVVFWGHSFETGSDGLGKVYGGDFDRDRHECYLRKSTKLQESTTFVSSYKKTLSVGSTNVRDHRFSLQKRCFLQLRWFHKFVEDEQVQSIHQIFQLHKMSKAPCSRALKPRQLGIHGQKPAAVTKSTSVNFAEEIWGWHDFEDKLIHRSTFHSWRRFNWYKRFLEFSSRCLRWKVTWFLLFCAFWFKRFETQIAYLKQSLQSLDFDEATFNKNKPSEQKGKRKKKKKKAELKTLSLFQDSH